VRSTRVRVGVALTVLVTPTIALTGVWLRRVHEQLAHLEGRVATFEREIAGRDWRTGGGGACRVEDVVARMGASSYGTPETRAIAREAASCAASWNAAPCAAGICDAQSLTRARQGLPLLDPQPGDTGCLEAAADSIALAVSLAAGCGEQGAVDHVEQAMTTMVACPVPDAGALARARSTLLALTRRPAPPVSGFVDRAVARDARHALGRARRGGTLSTAWFATRAGGYIDALLAVSSAVHTCEQTTGDDCGSVVGPLEAHVWDACVGDACGSSVGIAAFESDALVSAARASVVLVDVISDHARTGAWRDPPSASDPAFASTWRHQAPAIEDRAGGPTLFTWTIPFSSSGLRERIWLP